MARKQEWDTEVACSAMNALNGGAGSKGRMVDSCTYFLCFDVDILAFEGVQRRFTRLIPEMRGLSYEERLSRLGLYSLEFRRMRGDLIETYKILRGIDRVDAGRMFPPLAGESRTRGHSLRIRGRPFRTEMRRNFITQRVMNLWNSLPQSLGIFKAEIDRFLKVWKSMDMGIGRESGVEVEDQP